MDTHQNNTAGNPAGAREWNVQPVLLKEGFEHHNGNDQAPGAGRQKELMSRIEARMNKIIGILKRSLPQVI